MGYKKPTNSVFAGLVGGIGVVMPFAFAGGACPFVGRRRGVWLTFVLFYFPSVTTEYVFAQ